MRVWILVLFISGLAHGQIPQAPPTFRAGTTIIRVDAQVLDKTDRVIGGLNKDDFVVLEDRKPQPILHFVFESDPLDLLLLIDKSGSMQLTTAELAFSAVGALSVLRSGDRVGVILFDTKSELLVAPTHNMKEVAAGLEGAIREENIRGGTNINGAVFDAAVYMRGQPKTEARRSILILTDNRSFKTKKDKTVVRELWEADAVLNALIFESRMVGVAWKAQQVRLPFLLLLDANVKNIVEQTGGEWLRAGAPVESFREMVNRIRKRYTLHYRAPAGPAGKMRSIRVELSPESLKRYPGAKVRARHGYIPAEAVP
jgi:VWFA-related protein